MLTDSTHALRGFFFPAPFLAAVLILGLSLSAARADDESGQPVNQSTPAAAKGRVHIENIAGTVTVAGWDREEVSVEGTICEKCKLELDRQGDRVDVVVRYPKNSHGWNNHSGESLITVRVPSGNDLSLQTVSANEDVSGITGGLMVETVSGNLVIKDSPSRVETKSVSGDTRIDATTSRVTAESVSGNISLVGPEGEAEVSNVSGDINVDRGRFSRLELSAVSGDIDFAGLATADAHLEFSSHSGSVTLRLPAEISAEFTVETFSGDIESELGGSPEPKSKYGPGRQLEFTAGSGSASIEVSSFSGEVRLLKK